MICKEAFGLFTIRFVIHLGADKYAIWDQIEDAEELALHSFALLDFQEKMSLRSSLKVHGDFADGVKSEANNRVLDIGYLVIVCVPLPDQVSRDRIDDEKSCEETEAPRRLDEHSKQKVTHDEQRSGLHPSLTRLFLNKIAFVYVNHHHSHRS